MKKIKKTTPTQKPTPNQKPSEPVQSTTVQSTTAQSTTVQSTTAQSTSFYDQYIQVQRPQLALTIFRILFFSLLFYDLWFISLIHAPRYGVAGFNVAHLPFLEAIFTPNVTIQGGLYLIGGLLSLWMIFAWVNRFAYMALALIYSVAYFDSQADSYQHHYLLSLILILMAFFPWNQPLSNQSNQANQSNQSNPSTDSRKSYFSHWTLDAIAFELALVYLWTAFTKSETVWLSGQPLRSMVASSSAMDQIQAVSIWFNLSTDQIFVLGAWTVMLGEFLAPILLIFSPLRKFGFLIIPWFHIMVEWIGFDIELFSYYMLLFNFFFLSPEWIWRGFDRIGLLFKKIFHLWILIFDHLQKRLNHKKSTPQMLLFRVISSLVVYLLLSQLQVEGKQIIALIAGICTLVFLDWQRLNMLHVLSITLILICAVMWLQSSEVLYDYYRMWGGDLQRRGELSQSVEIYKFANQLKKTGNARHYALGQILVDLKQYDEATLVFLDGLDRHLKEKERLKAYLFEHVNHKQSLEDQFQNEVQLADRILSFKVHLQRYPSKIKISNPINQISSLTSIKSTNKHIMPLKNSSPY